MLTPRLLCLLNGAITHAHVHGSTCWHESACVYKEGHSGVCAHTLASAVVLLSNRALALWICPRAHMCVHTKRHTHMCSCITSCVHACTQTGVHVHTGEHIGIPSQTHTHTYTCSLSELFAKRAAMNPFPAFMLFVVSPLHTDLRLNHVTRFGQKERSKCNADRN